MKTIFTLFFLLTSFKSISQINDILYIPSQKSLVVSYNNHSPLGFYAGGYLLTSFPQPYIYTTPISIINRLGVNIINQKSTLSVMGGFFLENFQDSLAIKPDVWIKIYPFRTILNVSKGPDLAIGLNYMNGFRYAIGVSIAIRGIYR
jgi:hypothetical protein